MNIITGEQHTVTKKWVELTGRVSRKKTNFVPSAVYPSCDSP